MSSARLLSPPMDGDTMTSSAVPRGIPAQPISALYRDRMLMRRRWFQSELTMAVLHICRRGNLCVDSDGRIEGTVSITMNSGTDVLVGHITQDLTHDRNNIAACRYPPMSVETRRLLQEQQRNLYLSKMAADHRTDLDIEHKTEMSDRTDTKSPEHSNMSSSPSSTTIEDEHKAEQKETEPQAKKSDNNNAEQKTDTHRKMLSVEYAESKLDARRSTLSSHTSCTPSPPNVIIQPMSPSSSVSTSPGTKSSRTAASDTQKDVPSRRKSLRLRDSGITGRNTDSVVHYKDLTNVLKEKQNKELEPVVIKKEIETPSSEQRTQSPETYLNISPLDLSSSEYSAVAGISEDFANSTGMYGVVPGKVKSDQPASSTAGYSGQAYGTDSYSMLPRRASDHSGSRSPYGNTHTCTSDLGGIADTLQLQRAGRTSVAPYVDMNSQYVKRNDVTLDDYMSNHPYSQMPLMVEKKHTCPYCQRAFGTSTSLFKHMRNDSCSADGQPQAPAVSRPDTIMDNGGRPRVRNQRAADVHGPTILGGTLSTEMYYRHLAYSQSMMPMPDDQSYLSRDYSIEDNETVVVKTEPGLEFSNKENLMEPEVGDYQRSTRRESHENNNKVGIKHANSGGTKPVRQRGNLKNRIWRKGTAVQKARGNLQGNDTKKVSPLKLTLKRNSKARNSNISLRNMKPSELIRKKLKNCSNSVKCAQCTKVFVSDYHYQIHKAKDHTYSIRKYACRQCERVFVTKAMARYHKNNSCKKRTTTRR